ncbi:PLD nuclease N-terminal domain-containing protein [Sphaerothrix gracilis]|uniref:PLD nuclease N-terminal domain-containing protein n=1 Tax=Sphaerothrix gracilis TaxID=3151835 RepID=UPI0031FE38A4
MKPQSPEDAPYNTPERSVPLTPEQEQLQYERARSEQLARENQNLRSDRSAQIAQHNVAMRREENQRIAQQRANETSGFFWAIIIAILAVLGFGTFYFFGRTSTETAEPTTPQPQELPDINVEAPNIEVPDVNVSPPPVETPEVNIEVPNPIEGAAETAPAEGSAEGGAPAESAEGTTE